MVTQLREEITFKQRLARLTASDWARVQAPALGWDRAWENALALGGVSVAVPVMAAARLAGAGHAAAALAGAAAAAVDLEEVLDPADFEILFAPLAVILPRPARRLAAWGYTGAA